MQSVTDSLIHTSDTENTGGPCPGRSYAAGAFRHFGNDRREPTTASAADP
jgi:hypothetical protein